MDTMNEPQQSGTDAGPRPPRKYPRLMGALVIAVAIALVVAMVCEHYRLRGLGTAGGPGQPARWGGSDPTAPRASGEADEPKATEVWRKLDDGLQYGRMLSPRKAEAGDSIIHVVRIDPRRYEFRLMCGSALSPPGPLSARQWCQQNGLAAAINASMYATDGLTSVSLMKGPKHVNNPHVSKDKMMFVFGPADSDAAWARLADLDRERVPDVLKKYTAAVQSIRMLSAAGNNVWSQQAKKHSVSAIGMDRQGAILFILSRSAYSVHDLIDVLTDLPLDLAMCMYTEGGSKAQLYVHAGGVELEAVGNFEAAATADNALAPAVPNVIGILKRP